MSAHKIIIAIDGYSSCGKSTLAKELAKHLHYNFIDSGAMYRAITLYFLRNAIDVTDAIAVTTAMTNINLSFELNPTTRQSEICLNDENVEGYIRDMLVSDKVSEVAALREVRTFAVAQQKEMGKKKGIIMDGRDIGTSVFPQAELKLFMTAEPEVRVMRRFKELHASNPHITLDEVRHNLELRDYVDSTREESPLRRANDAILLDNSNMTREEQFNLVMSLVEKATAPRKAVSK